MTLKTWECSKCGYRMSAMGIEAYHPCPKANGRANTKMIDITAKPNGK